MRVLIYTLDIDIATMMLNFSIFQEDPDKVKEEGESEDDESEEEVK